MKPSVFFTVALCLASACDSGPQILVQASLNGRPVADLPVTLLPYDRDRLLDSLRRSAGDDAPTLPQELLRELAGVDSALARPARDSMALRRADSLRTVREKLAAEADTARAELTEWTDRMLHRADSLGREAAAGADRAPAADTTDADGRATLTATPGQSWLRARYILPDAVIEWNVPVTLPAGQDSVRVTLDRENARALAP